MNPKKSVHLTTRALCYQSHELKKKTCDRYVSRVNTIRRLRFSLIILMN